MNTIRTSILAASTVLALGAFAMGTASATGWDPNGNSDPYTYGPTTSALTGVRADVGSPQDPTKVQVGIYDNHNKLLGFEWQDLRK